MRPVNFSKLDEVKLAALKTIVQVGYTGATIAVIAKVAGVSDGYLYRHYKNKAELVKSLFIENMDAYHNHIFALISKEHKVSDVLYGSLSFMVETINFMPEIIAFIFLMDHDHNFKQPDEVKENFLKIGQLVRSKGIKSGEINEKRSVEDVLAIIFGLPVKMVELRRKGVVTTNKLCEKDVTNMAEICMNALK